MQKHDSSDVIRAEIPVIIRMLEDETWYEGERRHAFVDPHDPAVIDRVLDICTKTGARILEEAEKKMADSEEPAS